MQAGSVPSSATGSEFESVLRSMLERVLRVYLAAYSQAGWECAIKSNWERIVRQAGAIECNQVCTSERTWEHAMKCIWQLAFKFVVCSVMYSMCSAMYGIQLTKSHVYHSNQVNVGTGFGPMACVGFGGCKPPTA